MVSYQPDAPIGPAYQVNIDYNMNIRLHGPESGTISILIPEGMFGEQFFQDLANNHPVDLGDFKVDFLGMVTATDSQGQEYNPVLLPVSPFTAVNTGSLVGDSDHQIMVISHEGTGILADIENLEIKIAVNFSVPVLGGVQIDISGKASGINIGAGFDLTTTTSTMQ